ncbi:alpha-ketoglutarate-dependent dioxygenase AlkB [Proteobacteria bacterium 005FR1]|nr:alpha-ketoglutarate-dependent dioxygenase AlkB [Proteobacteria bacterium 005FR1]
MNDLFQTSSPERISLDAGELVLIRDWLSPLEADNCFHRLRGTTAWEQSTITIAGRKVLIPRLNAWYGDPGMSYRYSGTRFEAFPWTGELAELRSKVQGTADEFCGPVQFAINSALLNLYRDGNDSVGWHADNEAELGPQPQIASLSLGATRRFVLKQRRDKGRRLELELTSGSLLLMLGDLQQHWLHAVPKTRKPVGERINLTFRQVARPA